MACAESQNEATTVRAPGQLRRLWSNLAVRTLAWGAAGLAVGLIGLLVFCLVRFGSAGAFVAMLRSQPVLVEPTRFDIGVVPAGTRHELKTTVCNLTPSPFAINGLELHCSLDGCFNPGTPPMKLPHSIPAYTATRLPFRFTAPTTPRGAFEARIKVFTESGLREVVVCGVVPPTPTAASGSESQEP
jgi:hypothetical protein